MGFYEIVSKYKGFEYERFFEEIQPSDIERILQKDSISELEFLALISPVAKQYIEPMAQKARSLSLRHFGKAVLLYAPIYISNYCINRCAYCGFNCSNDIGRKKLSMEEVEKEAIALSKTGIRHVLLLTGESPKDSPSEYVIEAAKVAQRHFDSVTIEVNPFELEEYKAAERAGVDGMTVYQETYDEIVYDRVHLSGPKKDYGFRLDTPERACMANMRTVNIGALLGLSDWKKDAFMVGLHAKYLQEKYPHVEVGISFPRIRPHAGIFEDVAGVHDIELVQIMLAARLFLPHISQNISTRESREFRDNLIPLGINKFSAGSCTEVGGYSSEDSEVEAQFQISDERSVKEVESAIIDMGYQPLYKNWHRI